MSRPSEQEISDALDVVSRGREASSLAAFMRAMNLIRVAVLPREVWPAKEASAYLNVQPAHLPKLKGLPAPAQVLDRPSATHPEKKAYLYWADEIRAFGVSSGRVKEGGS